MSRAHQTIIIHGGRIIDPANKLDQISDLVIENGKIKSLTSPPNQAHESDHNAIKIDASGLIVCPGLIDLCARLREPGLEHKGTIKTETQAAAAAGITRLCTPPDTDPVVDTPAVATLIQDKADSKNACRVSVIGALTQGLRGEQLSEMYALKKAGCIGVSNAWQAVENNQTLRRCMEYAATFDLTLFVNPQDPDLTNGGCAHEGHIAAQIGLPSIPETAETIAVAQHLLLAEQVGIRIHFNQLSAARSVSLIREAQARGLAVSADVSAHQLILADDVLSDFEGIYHVRPPLRCEKNRAGLIKGVQDGTIASICSDHQPHEKAAKMAPFAVTEPGISGLETLLPLSLSLVSNNSLNLTQAIERLTAGPASIIQCDEGKIEIGRTANLCLFDPEAEYLFTEDKIQSSGKNSPFLNQTLKGRVRYTILEGQISFQSQPL